ncbi:MAG: IS1595 family transposase [Sulfuricaulis sp.]|uniref:IS1595 family transposase n=1 Tax=Sulfuricaulis sp. TaxID=2003553 RepID=UPI0025FC468B|nr:IS1595 family transposase [Sulfuricaulis sp.]MCR4345695.1 IS1595 family transposase [Sulfuricaulis sp.]
MTTSNLNAPHFKDADKARQYLEAQVWPHGSVCPHCGVIGEHYELKGKSTRPGVYKCRACRDQFTVTVGTLFERSKIPLNVWLQAVYLLCSSKKGMSSHQLHRTLGVTYKTAWFMTHRIREAMKKEHTTKLGGGGKVVEVDETFWGKKPGVKRARQGSGDKEKIFALIERGGEVRSFHVPDITSKTLRPIMLQQIEHDTKLMTDTGGSYHRLKRSDFKSHRRVTHKRGEYVRGEVYTNTIESYFNVLKRGLYGTYQRVASHHLKRYLYEFDFRHSHRTSLGVSDTERTEKALQGIIGKRLTYRRSDAKA